MTLSGQLEQVLVENENAAGRLWDMSAGQLRRGDYQLIVKYGDFLTQQPELMKLAEQLGRSREAKSVPKKDAPMETFRTLVREPATVPEQVDGLQQSDDILRLLPTELSTLGMTELEYEFYRRLVKNSFSPTDCTVKPGARKSANGRSSIRILMNSRAGHSLFAWIRPVRWAGLTSSARRRSVWH